MAVYTTEIASDQLTSDNPIHQRLLQAYYLALPYVNGNLLEVGCGEGRGLELLIEKADAYTGVDKITEVIDRLSAKYPDATMIQGNIPPFSMLEDDTFDCVVTFQVIEHIKDDKQFLQEIRRVLKPGGKALITTPNINMTLSRNPWHIREYTPEQLTSLASEVFSNVEMKGIAGNERVMEYYHKNKASVDRIMRFDVLNLQYRLPAAVLRLPYELLNRMNRNKLKTSNDALVNAIDHDDYLLTDDPSSALDLFCIVTK